MWILREAWDNGGLGFHNACDFTRVEKPLLHTSVIDMREVILLTCETDVELGGVDVRCRNHGRAAWAWDIRDNLCTVRAVSALAHA